MRSLAVLVLLAACMTPRPPRPPQPSADDRFVRTGDPDPARRASAAGELAFDPSPQAIRALLDLLQRDGDPRVRTAAVAAIEQRHDPNFETALAYAATYDPDPAARGTAAKAYSQMWKFRKTTTRAVGFSILCPGCGHLYLRENEGFAYLGASAALIGSSIALVSGETIAVDGTAESAKVPLGLELLFAAQNLWFYSIFDAYRDARVLRDDAGYSFEITRESLPELASAPFRPRVLASPWVWGAVPIALLAGLGISYLIDPDEFEGSPSIRDVDKVNVLGRDFGRGAGFAAGAGYFAGLFVPVGVGEEALFRGVIQTDLEERLGRTGGLIAASAIFGAVHFLNFTDDPAAGAIAVPVITILGASLGLAYQRTGHRLSTSVAMHFWYDFLLSCVAFAADPTHQPFVVRYGAPMP